MSTAASVCVGAVAATGWPSTNAFIRSCVLQIFEDVEVSKRLLHVHTQMKVTRSVKTGLLQAGVAGGNIDGDDYLVGTRGHLVY